MKMQNYYKYLPVSAEDEKWGLCVLNVGSSRINKSEPYPPEDHPAHHFFDWNKGRILNEYQIIYITKGEGLFESQSCMHKVVKEGTILLLFPGEWHRFKPNIQTGWDEFWIGCKGEIIDNLMSKEIFQQSNPSLYIGLQENIIELFAEIIEQTKYENPGYQPLISGAVNYVLGIIHAKTKQENFNKEDVTGKIVNRARLIFRNSVTQNISVAQIAEQLQVSYAWFRKAFKEYTGMAPGQYFIQLKIDRAKTLLSDMNKPVKLIAFELNFESAFYFSKLFKGKTGMSPEQYRKTIRPKHYS